MPDIELVPMPAVEFLPLNAELRSHARYFQEKPGCTSVEWYVKARDHVTAGQVIGRFTFVAEPTVDIVAPIEADVVKTYLPRIADLAGRPSVPIALFQPSRPRAVRSRSARRSAGARSVTQQRARGAT